VVVEAPVGAEVAESLKPRSKERPTDRFTKRRIAKEGD